MAIPLRQSTASQEVPLGPFLDIADGNTEETAITLSAAEILIWKSGATSLVAKNSGDATHMQNGIFYAVLDATDTNTLGPLVIFARDTAALWVRLECVVLPANAYDASIAGTDTIQADVTQWNGTAVTTPATAGSPVVTLADAAITTAKFAANAIAAATLAADVTTELQSGLATAVAVADLPTNAELATALGTADDAVLAAVAAIDAKIDIIDTNVDQIETLLGETDTDVAAIKAKTDSLTFTEAGVVDANANVTHINDVEVTGDGALTPWGPAA
jgi:NifU-like protein involved in Fe-S cluster formation